MFPSIRIGGAFLPVFPFILLLAIFLCLYRYLFSNTYCPPKQGLASIKRILFLLLCVLIGGRGTSILSLLCQGKTIGETLQASGFVFYGGLVGAIVGLLFLCRFHFSQFLAILDVFASLLPLGQTIGRLGCYCNGCCYGIAYDGFFSVPYTIGGAAVRVFPTWFAESLFCLILFLVLSKSRNASRLGFCSAKYGISYSVFRFFLEFLRGDDIRGRIGILSTSQALSIPIFLFSIFLLFYSRKEKRDNPFFIKKQATIQEEHNAI